MPVEERTEQATPSHNAKKRKSEALNGIAQTPDRVEKSAPPSHKTRGIGEVFNGVGKGGEGARGRLWVCDVSCVQVMAVFLFLSTIQSWELP